MLKKIRCMYWKKRDEGKEKQFLMGAGLFLFLFVILTGASIRGVIREREQGTGVTSGSAVSGEAVSGSGVSGTSVSGTGISDIKEEMTDEEETELEEEESSDSEEVMEEEPDEEDIFPEENSEDTRQINTDGLSSYAGFMSESSYQSLIRDVEQICRQSGADVADKQIYQTTGKTDFDIITYILIGEKDMYECGYNLKSAKYSLQKTSLTAAQLKEKEKKREQEEIKKQQAEKKTAAKKSKKKSKSKITKKKSSKKKSSGKGSKKK